MTAPAKHGPAKSLASAPWPYGQQLPKLLFATKIQLHHAQLIAEGRQRGKATRRPEGDIGSQAKNLEADRVGALAEIIVLHALMIERYRPEQYRPLEQYHVPAADFVLNGRSFEIKAAPREFVCINARQHDARRCDFYLPVLFVFPSIARICAPITHAEVDIWELRPGANGRPPYHSRHRDSLRPLFDWKELVS